MAHILKNTARSFEKHCSWFWKTLLMVLENVARDFFKRCPWFFKTLPMLDRTKSLFHC